MPVKKQRSLRGNGNTISSHHTQSSPPSILHKNAIANNVNGTSDHDDYHHSIDEPQLKLPATNVNGTNGTYATHNGAISAAITFTPKQQQQLDRNAFLLTLTKDQLKVECRKRGQKSTGTKTDLVHSTHNTTCIFFFFFFFYSFSFLCLAEEHSHHINLFVVVHFFCLCGRRSWFFLFVCHFIEFDGTTTKKYYLKAWSMESIKSCDNLGFHFVIKPNSRISFSTCFSCLHIVGILKR